MPARLCVLIPLLFCSNVYASELYPKWSGWLLNPHSSGCELSNSFLTRDKHKGELEGTAFHRIHVYFTATTFASPSISEKDLYKTRFHLRVVPREHKVLPPHRIGKAVVNGFEAIPMVMKTHHKHDFSFDGQASSKIFETFSQDEPLNITLIFKNGERRQFRIYPRANKVNHVFGAMFQTCIQQHRPG